jgi:hypothetical protein
MATNPYFSNLTYAPTQTLMEDLLIESIKMYGMDVIYLPRTLIDIDTLWGEAAREEFNSGKPIEMYLNNVEGFEGNGDLLSKFGVEIRDQTTFWVSRRRFQEEFENTELEFAQYDGTTELLAIQPREGDLIYLPMNGNFFQIMFAEDEKLFYPQGKLMVYELRCELFERSSEDFNTGNTIIDSIETMYPVSNVETSMPDDTSQIAIDKDTIIDFTEHSPFGEL